MTDKSEEVANNLILPIFFYRGVFNILGTPLPQGNVRVHRKGNAQMDREVWQEQEGNNWPDPAIWLADKTWLSKVNSNS